MKIRIALCFLLGTGILISRYEAHAADAQAGRPRISPEKVEFGVQNVGRAGEPRSVTLSNPGPAPLEIASILTSGIDFSQSNDCGRTLATGAQCTIQLVFKPAIVGPRIGQLSVISSVPVQSLALSGTGE